MTYNVEHEERSYSFTCRSCLSQWTRRYLVAEWADEDGVQREAFLREQVPVPNPTRGTVCPRCGSNRVTVLALVHGHPILASPPEPESQVTVPRSIRPRPKLEPRTRAFP
jgi:hypothetical protein